MESKSIASAPAALPPPELNIVRASSDSLCRGSLTSEAEAARDKRASLVHSSIYFYERPTDAESSSHFFLNVHYPCYFTGDDGRKYRSCTDYYHTNKMLILGDKEGAEEVHKRASPDEAFYLSRELQAPFENTPKWTEWEEKKVEVMKTAIRLKFEKNSALMQELIMTGDRALIDAHPTDDFWGGALPGSKNMMGKLLMELRDQTKAQRKVIPVVVSNEDGSEDDDDDAVCPIPLEHSCSISMQEVLAEQAIKFIQRRLSTYGPASPFKSLNTSEDKKKEEKEAFDEKALRATALKEIRRNPPLMYLPNDQSASLVAESRIEKIEAEAWLVKLNDPNDMHEAFFVIQGEAYVFNETGYLEMLNKGTFLGANDALFNKRKYAVKGGKDLIVLRIPAEILLKYLKKDSKLTLNLARNMMLKDNILDGLNHFKSYVRQLRTGVLFDRAALIRLYKGMDSALHPMCNSPNLDIDAWLYSNRRLPQNITSTLVFFITTKYPELLSHPDVTLSVKTSSRPRQIFQTMPGKCVAILRDLETDLFDFVSNLCIHIVECEKLLHKLKSPEPFRDLLLNRSSQEKVLEILKRFDLSADEIAGLARIWPTNLGEHISNILMHHNDFMVSVLAPISYLKLDDIETWIKNMWFATAELLGLDPETSCESIPDDQMTIDVLQGSRRAFSNLVSPYIYVHKQEILDWAAKTNPKLITKQFNCEEDKLYAYAHYYFLNHTECAAERQRLEKENGIFKIDQPGLTGVTVTLVDCAKLHKEYCDPALIPKAASKYHVIINIGYTFGIQSSDIIRSMMNIFGRKIRTISIVGKAGGMTGHKGDLMLATRIHSDESFEVVNNNLGGLNVEKLQRSAGRPVHVGPMLTVAGTIIQNSVLLNYFRKLFYCVGLEMEGLHFAREIKRYRELGIVREDVISRFAYYISDLPLDPNSTLSKEEGEVSFDEGVPSLNAIYRNFTQALFE